MRLLTSPKKSKFEKNWHECATRDRLEIMKKHLLILFVLSSIISSCLMEEPDRHHLFESISDCSVYEYEVESDSFLFGTVEYIDTSKASGCVKSQLQNKYLLHLNDSTIVVYRDHPKNHIQKLNKNYQEYLKDTSKLMDFITNTEGYLLR